MTVVATKTKTFRNIAYASFGKVITLICVAATSSVVARNLSPSDYGVLGFAGIIIAFLGHFSDVGIGSAAIRRPSLDEKDLDTAFTLKIVLSFGAFIIAFLVAPFAHHVFAHPAIGNVIRVVAANFLISCIGFMPTVVLSREQNFRALSKPQIAGAIVRCFVAIGLVLHGWKYWAVVLADLMATLTTGLVMQWSRKMPLRLHFDPAVTREYLRFGMPLFGTGLLVFSLFNMDNFLIGSKMGADKLGYYALAFTWGSFVCVLLADTVNSVLLPAFSAIQNDLAAMRRWYLKTVDLGGFVAVVGNTALLANAHLFLVTFLGKGSAKWIPAALSLELLCLYGIIRALTEPLGNCIMASGHTGLLLRSNTLAGIVEVVLILSVLRFGRIDLVAGSVLIAYATQAMVYLPYVRRSMGITAGEMGGLLWPLIPAIVGGYAFTQLIPDSLGGTIVTLAGRGVFTMLVTALIHGLCTRFRCLQEARGMVLQNFARLRA